MSNATLLLIDGHSCVRRVYEAITDAPDEAARVARALRSSLQSVRLILEANPTTHALVVFDHGGQNWRHRLYPEYKANRPPSTPEFKAMIPELRKRIEGALGVLTHSVPDVEADDVIAAITRKAIEAGIPGDAITVSTTDKDLAWLMCRGVRIWVHHDRKHKTEDDIVARFGVGSAQILDYLALAGDKSDGVPGLHGCGPATAVKWLTQYGNLPGIIANAAEIGGAIGQKLRENMAALKLSRLLVSFKTDIQCGVTWNQLRRE